MSYGQDPEHLKNNPYARMAHDYSVPAAQASVSDRVSFIQKTYLHLAMAIGAFVLIETIIFSLFGEQIMANVLPRITGMSWLVVLGAYMGVSWLADRWAHSETSVGKQYLGLGLYVLVECAIFVPILAIAQQFMPGSIATAGIITVVVFGGLTLTVFATKADFSFLRMALVVGSLAALAAIVVGTVMSLPIFGIVFCGAMVLLAAGSILYSTSNVLHHYRTDQHVAASLSLFAAIALLFWYILQLVMILSNE